MLSKICWDGLHVLGHFQEGRHRNLEITPCVLKQLNFSLYICLWGEKFHYANKKCSCLWIIYKQLFKRIFRVFSVIFCVMPWAREDLLGPTVLKNNNPYFNVNHAAYNQSANNMECKHPKHVVKINKTTVRYPNKPRRVIST